MMTKGPKRDMEKERRWRRLIGEAARSGLSVREFCRRRRLNENQFYAWRRELRYRQQTGPNGAQGNSRASFALVSADGGDESAGIELTLACGRKLRISRGVDAETLKTVVGALTEEAKKC